MTALTDRKDLHLIPRPTIIATVLSVVRTIERVPAVLELVLYHTRNSLFSLEDNEMKRLLLLHFFIFILVGGEAKTPQKKTSNNKTHSLIESE